MRKRGWACTASDVDSLVCETVSPATQPLVRWLTSTGLVAGRVPQACRGVIGWLANAISTRSLVHLHAGPSVGSKPTNVPPYEHFPGTSTQDYNSHLRVATVTTWWNHRSRVAEALRHGGTAFNVVQLDAVSDSAATRRAAAIDRLRGRSESEPAYDLQYENGNTRTRILEQLELLRCRNTNDKLMYTWMFHGCATYEEAIRFASTGDEELRLRKDERFDPNRCILTTNADHAVAPHVRRAGFGYAVMYCVATIGVHAVLDETVPENVLNSCGVHATVLLPRNARSPSGEDPTDYCVATSQDDSRIGDAPCIQAALGNANLSAALPMYVLRFESDALYFSGNGSAGASAVLASSSGAAGNPSG